MPNFMKNDIGIWQIEKVKIIEVPIERVVEKVVEVPVERIGKQGRCLPAIIFWHYSQVFSED